MAKTATATKTKTATKTANDKKTRPTTTKAAVDKPKREPSAYQLFCKAHMKEWNEQNPGRAKEAMGQMAKLWKDAPENPNRGSDPKSRKPKAPKAAAAPKAKAPRKAAKKKDDTVEEEDDEGGKESSDPVDGADGLSSDDW